jgi:hypothetical protein
MALARAILRALIFWNSTRRDVMRWLIGCLSEIGANHGREARNARRQQIIRKAQAKIGREYTIQAIAPVLLKLYPKQHVRHSLPST